jgi:hypothetical protein
VLNNAATRDYSFSINRIIHTFEPVLIVMSIELWCGVSNAENGYSKTFKWKILIIVWYVIVLYCIVLYCIVLYCIVLYCIVLYCIVCYVMLCYVMVWYGMLCYVMVWYGMVWYGIRNYTVWQGMVYSIV